MEVLWQNPIYILATILHPSYRTSYFQKLKKQDKDFGNKGDFNVDLAIDEARNFWQDWVKENSTAQTLQYEKRVRRQTNMVKEKPLAHRTIYEMNERYLGEWALNDQQRDEFEEFISTPGHKLKDQTPLQWWRTDTQQAQWPLLSQLAVMIMSMPSMSAGVEQFFSGSRRTISWERASLEPEMIEGTECLKRYFIAERQRTEDSIA
jgi:polyhydroxyalkanoate synthesis regulator phasin